MWKISNNESVVIKRKHGKLVKTAVIRYTQWMWVCECVNGFVTVEKVEKRYTGIWHLPWNILRFPHVFLWSFLHLSLKFQPLCLLRPRSVHVVSHVRVGGIYVWWLNLGSSVRKRSHVRHPPPCKHQNCLLLIDLCAPQKELCVRLLQETLLRAQGGGGVSQLILTLSS